MSASQEKQVENTEPCANPGNPVFSCMLTSEMKGRHLALWSKTQHPLYRTTSSDYGLRTQTSGTSRRAFYPKSQKFTEEIRKTGLFRDNSLNTTLDRSKVYDCPDLQNTI